MVGDLCQSKTARKLQYLKFCRCELYNWCIFICVIRCIFYKAKKGINTNYLKSIFINSALQIHRGSIYSEMPITRHG